MADNYLEKKMEEHRQQPRRSTTLTCAGRRPGFALLPYDIKTAFIYSADAGELLQTIANELRGSGCRVAIACPDSKDARAISQKCGCSFVPVLKDNHMAAYNTITAKWGEPELCIEITDVIKVRVSRCESTIIQSDTCTDADFARRAARMCIYLSLPDSIGRVSGEFTI